MTKTTKIWLIIATTLLLTGCIIFGGVMTVYKWDFSKLSTNKYETNKYDIADNFKNISINVKTADIVFVASEKAKTEVVCYEQDNANHEVSVDNDTLTIKLVDERKWYEYIGINFRTPKITVYLPQGEYGNLNIDSSTGDIDIKNLSAENINLTVTTGEIEAKSITCNGDFKTTVSTGEVELKDVSCKNLFSNGNTGHISLKDVIAEEKLTIERSTGDIKFELCDANEIFVKTDTGDVKGSLLSDKVFITQTDTGSVNVPKTTTGGKCEITTDTGDIKITVKHSGEAI